MGVRRWALVAVAVLAFGGCGDDSGPSKNDVALCRFARSWGETQHFPGVDILDAGDRVGALVDAADDPKLAELGNRLLAEEDEPPFERLVKRCRQLGQEMGSADN